MSKYDYDVDMTTNNSHSLILHRISNGSKVLEFGPATGSMTRYMKEELGCQIYCVEIDENAAEKAKIYCDKMIISDLDSLEWTKELYGQKFDHIIYADVLEHLYNPWKVLEISLGFLKENGTVISSIPNVSHSAIIMELLEGKFKYNKIGLLDDTHIRFFTKNSILDLLEKSGLFPVEWMATFVLPEQTEFRQKYSNVPRAVEKFLKEKENAHVYQFVTVSKKKHDVSIEEYCTQLVTKPDYLFNEYLQLFWEVNGVFKEECSIKTPIINSQEFVSYEVVIPEEECSRLRLDPINQMAYVEIKSIVLFDDDPYTKQALSPRMIWSEENTFFGLHEQNGIQRLKGQGSYCFLCTSEDSHLILNGIPHTKSNKNWYLRILMRVSKEIPEIIFRANENIECVKSELIDKENQIRLAIDNHSIASKILEEKERFLFQLKDTNQYLQTELMEKSKLLTKKDEQLAELTGNSDRIQKTLEDLINSTSWKITAPLRKMRHIYKKQ